MVDHRRSYGLAVWRSTRLPRGVKGRSVSIGKRTLDNGVRARRKGFLACTAALPHVAGAVAVPALPLHRLCGSEYTGGGRERPPVVDCLDRHSRGWTCARPCHRPEGSFPSLNQSLREGCQADRACR